MLIGLGLLLSTGTAFWGLLFGGAPLDMLAADLTVPLVGELHLSTVLLFDLGVYITVVGHGAGHPAQPRRRAGPADRGGGQVTASLVPFAASGVLVATGVTLLLERSLVRLLAGVILLGNGVNLLILTAGGPAGEPPILGRSDPDRMADPLPQAMVLTSIVITLGVTAFLLAMVHRSWQLTGGDEVQDDTEDRRVRLRARRGELAQAVLDRQEAYRRMVREQRAELARLEAARHERERREAEELEQRILDVNVDLGRWLQENKDEGLSTRAARGALRRGPARRGRLQGGQAGAGP